MQYTELIKKPAPESINGGLSPLKTQSLLSILGKPRTTFTQECQPITHPVLKRRIMTKSVGPFRVTGLDIAVDSLAQVFTDVKEEEPELYAVLQTAGMLCCRLVRGAKHTLSNHSYGCAVDLRIGGKLDVRGDDRVQYGLFRLYRYFHRHGWYWGAEYPTEDGMHWELSWEKFRELNKGR